MGLSSGGGLSRTVWDRICYHCGEVWHIQKSCLKVSVNPAGSMATTKPPEVKCYNCGTKGHNYCPALSAGGSKDSCSPQWGLMKKGFVEGQSVRDILLDTE